jgi:hypothetical protein
MKQRWEVFRVHAMRPQAQDDQSCPGDKRRAYGSGCAGVCRPHLHHHLTDQQVRDPGKEPSSYSTDCLDVLHQRPRCAPSLWQVLARTEEAQPGSRPHFDTRVLLGRRDDPLLLIYARQLIEQLRCTYFLIKS